MFVLASLSSSAIAERRRSRRVHTIGLLGYLGTDAETFQEKVDEFQKLLKAAPPNKGTDDIARLLNSFRKSKYEIRFYDSLINLILALDSDKVKEISVPEHTARYLMMNDPDYIILFTVRMPSTISFGFRNDDKALCNEFNRAILAMKNNGTLKALKDKYINNPQTTPEAVEFKKFAGAGTIKVAVTGDMPPIDYVAEDGSPAGYNTAVLSEIGKRLKKNIEVQSIGAGARTSSLMSGRADVIFWYRSTKGIDTSSEPAIKDNPLNSAMNDSSEGVLLSEPYYEWENNMILTF